ncbi:malic enzyme [Haematococcus lacustris]|uniref:Malic enzyme n=1 Tax=Haematococcus lacustris TaxID=44745 RepID=A0A699ZSQ1_HAELA|nr:malic enzyme [Haematococcus lacustris]
MPDYLEKMRAIPDSMGRYMFLRKLRQDDSQKFYRLMLDHTDEVLPFIYTPTVGEACERYHTLPDLKVRPSSSQIRP